MAAGKIHEGEGIIELAATEDCTRRMKVTHIVLTGTAAGAFVLTLGKTAITISTGANDFSKVIPVNRTLNYILLTSGPAGAALYAFLEKK